VPVTRYVNRWRSRRRIRRPRCPSQAADRVLARPQHPGQVPRADPAGHPGWNKAFEKIGYKDAIRVEVQPDDADFDTSDIKHASVRWQTVAKTSYGAIGPTVVDPRTGEILDADIGIDANNVRVVRNLSTSTCRLGASTSLADQLAARRASSSRLLHVRRRGHAGSLVRLVAPRRARRHRRGRGRRRQVRRLRSCKDVTMHEVGHTLGLRHNFRASTIYTETQLVGQGVHARARHRRLGHGIQPWNIALQGEKQGEFQMTTLGPYDYWAIEYGYTKSIPAARGGRARQGSRPARASPRLRTRPTRTCRTSPSTPR
jgi:hypothetical protein